LPGVEVKQTFPYLIRRIGTQVLFALILLLLTGSAFFFTNRSLKRQVIMNGLRNDFVSNITHELKTPVSTVKVALEALKTFDKVNNPAITMEYLDMAGQEMNRLDQLINKVLDQSMIGEQKEIIQPRLADLKELTRQALFTLQPRLTDRNASVRIEEAGGMAEVMVDPLHYQGIIINLIDNSLKYGVDIPEIAIRLWQEKGSARVEVSDNGPGIPPEYLGRVFDKFFRVPAGNTHNIKGYGLGLSFAALVMKQHGGSISVRNLESGGCAFTLRFPVETT
jgi:signal transduction histidine kinase